MKAEANSLNLTRVLEKARAIVFDFDGTLVDSNEIKWYGFEQTFKDFPDRLEEIMAYCRSLNHTIRGEKFRHVFENILKLPYTPDIDGVLHERYAAATTQAVIRAPEIPGARPFLIQAADKYKTAVLSSTPHDILLKILDSRGWLRYFN